MGERSRIEWTDATVNFWWGCTRVGPGCDHCYAEAWDKRTGGAHWGVGAPRRAIKGATGLINRLNRTRPGARVFVQSMSDLFDNEVPLGLFAHAWSMIVASDQLRIQIVTKRLPVAEKRLTEIGVHFWPRHVGLIATVCNQAEADRDIPRLLALKSKHAIPWVGLSIEPLLGPVDLECVLTPTMGIYPLSGVRTDGCGPSGFSQGPRVDWVIVGGESGPHARPMHPDWARRIRDLCVAERTPYFFKHWGHWAPCESALPGTAPVKAVDFDGQILAGVEAVSGGVEPVELMSPLGKARSGRLLDDRTWDQFPGERQ